MKKAVALLLVLPGVAEAKPPPAPEPWADEALREVIEASLAPPPVEADHAPDAAPPVTEAPASDSSPTPISYGAEVDVASRYVWRGLAFSEHPVLQPSARISDYGATLVMASSAYLGTEPGVEKALSELDLMGNYTFSIGAASFTPSIGAFFFAEAPATAELGATVGYDLSLFVLQTRQALDIADNAGGWYADVAAARSVPLGSRLRFDATTSLAWCSGSFARYYIDESISGLHWGAAQLDAALWLAPTDLFYVRLHGTASRLVEEHIRAFTPEANLLSGGLALGLAH